MEWFRVLIVSAWLVLSLGLLTGCGRDQLAEPARQHTAAEEMAEAPAASVQRPTAAAERAATTTTRRIAGKPMWADSRRYSAEENARYQFGQHGEELGAADLDDFLAKAHQFVNAPPKGAKTLVRANGDRLLYDPESGLFGVVRDDGAPRTVFKPADGEAYWAAQVRENAAAGTARRATGTEG